MSALPYNASKNLVERFQALRPGNEVRLKGVFLNLSRVELRSIYPYKKALTLRMTSSRPRFGHSNTDAKQPSS